MSDEQIIAMLEKLDKYARSKAASELGLPLAWGEEVVYWMVKIVRESLAEPFPTIDPSLLPKEVEGTFRAISDPKNAQHFSKEAAYEAFKDIPLPKEN